MHRFTNKLSHPKHTQSVLHPPRVPRGRILHGPLSIPTPTSLLPCPHQGLLLGPIPRPTMNIILLFVERHPKICYIRRRLFFEEFHFEDVRQLFGTGVAEVAPLAGNRRRRRPTS